VIAAPASIDALAAAIADSSPQPLRIAGAATKRPALAGADDGGTITIDMRGLSGLAAYDPAECVLTALAGTRVAEVADTLAAHGQYLPWDPPFLAEGATIGGMLAAGLNGPGRYRYGGVRDFVIGATVVDGRGRRIQSGGQVVKNAAGFLTHHVLAGSAGRLGAIAEVSFKVFPRPEATRTIVGHAAALADALAAHERVRLSGVDLDALDLDAATATLYVRVAGAAETLPARIDRARRALGVDADVVNGDDEQRVWADAAAALWTSGHVVKLPSTPTRLAADLAAVAALGACRASSGGAVIYVSTAEPVSPIERCLLDAGRAGAIVRGPAAGRLVGRPRTDAFAERVAAALDPDRRFR
jgi:glycolate oxidase FAD binding subunit